MVIFLLQDLQDIIKIVLTTVYNGRVVTVVEVTVVHYHKDIWIGQDLVVWELLLEAEPVDVVMVVTVVEPELSIELVLKIAVYIFN